MNCLGIKHENRSTAKVSGWIIKKAGTSKYTALISGILQCIAAACGIMLAFSMRSVIDNAVEGDKSGIYSSAAVFALLIAGQILLNAAAKLLSDRSRAATEKNLRQEVLADILKKDYTEASSYHSGDLLNRMTSDVSVIADGISNLIPRLISLLVKMIGVFAALYINEPVLAAIFAIGGIVFIAASNIPRKYLKKLHRRVQESDGAARCFFQECIESLLVIHAFGNERKMQKRSGSYLDVYRNAVNKRSFASAFFGTAISVIMQGGYFIGFVWCCFGIAGGRISYGTMTAVIQLIAQIQTPFSEMGSAVPKIFAIIASAERIIEISSDSESIPGSRNLICEIDSYDVDLKNRSVANGVVSAEIYRRTRNFVFDRVSFSYDDGREVLRNASFTVGKGEFVAFIGESGIGKSTLMKLMLSVYRPQSGGIYLRTSDGGMMSVNEIPGGMFAYVPQENHLMSGSIREAVGFAEQSDSVSEKRLFDACRAACAHEFITELPDGYDTVLGERGCGLSEGQMQRIAVARAIYSGCPVLLLDEATSALDGDTEKQMISAMKALNDRTVFFITHRSDTLAFCDRIIKFGADGSVC